MLRLNWIKSTTGNWCNLSNLNVESVGDVTGVYVIFKESDYNVVRVGQGNIKERLLEHRNNREITQYGPLFVTWAKVHPTQQNGVEAFLAQRCNPMVGERFPDVTPIAVNLPSVLSL